MLGSPASFPAESAVLELSGASGGQAFLWDPGSEEWPLVPGGLRHVSTVQEGGQQLGLSGARVGLMIKASDN